MAAGISGLIGGFYGSSEELYGRRPVVPEFPDYSKELQKTIEGNISLLPSLSELATKSTELYGKMMESATPGITALKTKGTQQIGSLLSGEVPEDVKRQLRQSAAESGVSTGAGGFGNERLLRSLGLTSLGLINEGISSAQRWISQAQSQTFDFSKMFMGPQDAIRQAEGRWSQQWLANQVAAAPDPAARGAFDSEMAFLGMVLSAYGGGAGYTQGYKPSYGGGGYGGQGGNYNFDRSYQSYFGAGSANQYYGNSNPSGGVYSGQNFNLDNPQDFSGYA